VVVHEQPQPSEGEQEQAPERRDDEDAMRYPGHEDPYSTEDPSSPDSA
jgi:hypothetical protein